MSRYDLKILEIKDKIVKELNPEKIILFGSYAWGTPTDDSDVDLFIIKKSDVPRRARQIELRKKLHGNGIPIDILVYTPEEVNSRLSINDVFLRKIFRDGKTIYEQ